MSYPTIPVNHNKYPKWAEPLHDNIVKAIQMNLPYLVNTTEITADVRYIPYGGGKHKSACATISFHFVKYDASMVEPLRNADLNTNVYLAEEICSAEGIKHIWEHTTFSIQTMLSQIVRWDIFGQFDDKIVTGFGGVK